MLRYPANKKIYLFVMLCMMTKFVMGQNKSYSAKERAILIERQINQYFRDSLNQLYYENNKQSAKENEHSFLWPLCALMQGANEMEVLFPKKKYLEPVLIAIEKYNNPAPPAAGYQAKVAAEGKDTRYYDDNQWIGIAAIDAYHRTKKKAYLALAEKTHRLMMTGLDTVSGGGIYWREGDLSTKNTCSNGPGVLLALQLYKATGKKGYLDTAILIYKWTNEKLQAPDGLFHDAIKLPSLKLDKHIYSYNSGTMLQANVILHQLTKQEAYLTEAKRIAGSAERYFFREGRFVDNYWFSVVLFRGFISLYENDRAKLRIFREAVDHVWEEQRDADGLMGKRKRKSLIDQAALLEIYARLAHLEIEDD